MTYPPGVHATSTGLSDSAHDNLDASPRLAWSPHWIVESTADSTLIASAGADRRIAIDGADATTLRAVSHWERAGEIEPSSDTERRMLDRLVELGAVSPIVPNKHLVGLIRSAAGATVADLLAASLADHDVVARSEHGAYALSLVVRSSRQWPPVRAGAHLGVDLTLHHTVVLGPLVVPGATACLQCAQTRAANRWGEPPIAETPRMTTYLAAVAALLVVQIELASQGISPLVNATIAWDLERGTTDRQSVYKLPGCEVCDVIQATGRVDLPWSVTAFNGVDR